MSYKYDICIVGGLGHIGLPLGIVFASKGLKVCLQDINKDSAEIVSRGELPFVEYEAEPLLKETLKNGNLSISLDSQSIAESKNIIIAIGTPVDEYMNSRTREFLEFISSLKEYLNPDQLIIIRSSVAPNACEQIKRTLGEGENWKLSYCPERIVQGYAIKELKKLPQIVAGFSDDAVNEASDLFQNISSSIIKTTMQEAELAKLFANSWRYIQFAIANQFFMICEDQGVDYNKVRKAMVEGYERASQLPSAGFAAGPCLLKDTMQISSFYQGGFLLGHSAMMVNEGLPNFLVNQMKSRYELKNRKVGILGMAFKADVDDIRDSLSFRLSKILKFSGAQVLCSDEFANNPEFVTKEEIVEKCETIIIAAPHSQYADLKFVDSTDVIDIWKSNPQ
jgi:UDP-N-acetyl-D-mannosaminuronic acid dehydrogenase